MGFPFVGLIIIAGVVLVAWLSALQWRRRNEAPYAGVLAIIGFLGVTAFIVLLSVSITKVFRSAETARARTECVANLNQVGRAMLLYMGDNNDRAPLANWNDGLDKYVDPGYLACPLLKPYGYTMSEMVIGVEASVFASPARTVAAFDGNGGKDSVGNEADIVYRHNGTAIFLYLDGHTKPANSETFEGLLPAD